MSKKLNIITDSIWAGIFIALGGAAFLKLGDVLGAVVFSFGLLAVIHNQKLLFTGRAGFCSEKKELITLIFILIFNIIGVTLAALLIKTTNDIFSVKATEITLSRLNLTTTQVIIKSFFCGFIMTTVVKSAKENKFLPLLFGVPLFIICGFIHCIADAFYYASSDFNVLINNLPKLFVVYILSVVGNFIGCITPNILSGSLFINNGLTKES